MILGVWKFGCFGYPQGIINFLVNDVLERNRNKRDVPASTYGF